MTNRKQPITSILAHESVKESNEVTEFEVGEIEDIRVIIKSKGKHFGIIPNNNEVTDEQAKEVRKLMFQMILPYHFVVSTALEDLK